MGSSRLLGCSYRRGFLGRRYTGYSCRLGILCNRLLGCSCRRGRLGRRHTGCSCRLGLHNRLNALHLATRLDAMLQVGQLAVSTGADLIDDRRFKISRQT